jgi:hypothetical protein
MVASGRCVSHGVRNVSSPGFALAAALLGFFVVRLDATVVNVALLSVRADFGGGISGLQWLAAGYTLMFAALLALVNQAGAAGTTRLRPDGAPCRDERGLPGPLHSHTRFSWLVVVPGR